MDKKQIRKQIKAAKSCLNENQWKVRSKAVVSAIESHTLFQASHTVMMFYPLPDEVDIRPLLHHWADSKRILLPVVEGDDIRLKRFEGDTQLHQGAFAISEPNAVACFTDYASIDLVLVPGIAFTEKGERLGRGKGYYDRFLPLLTHAHKAGVCFAFQLVDAIPTDPWDCLMDEVWHD